MADKSFTNAARPANTYVVGAGQAKAVIQFSALPSEVTNDVGKINTVTLPGKESQPFKVMYWGKANDLPQYREELLAGNNIVPALIKRRRDIICGQGWYAYKERFEDTGQGQMKRIMDEVPMTPEMEEFFDMFRGVDKDLVGELMKHEICIPEFIRGEGGKIVLVESKPIKYMRSGKKDANGKVNTWYWGNFWDTKRREGLEDIDKKIQPLNVYKPGTQTDKFILPLSDTLFNDGYYPIPAYWGGRHWIKLANVIPLFHDANLQHGQTPRWHIVIPFDFFWDYQKLEAVMTEEEKQKLYTEFKATEKAFIADLNKVLTGIGNTGRTITSKSEIVEAMGGKYEKRIHIEELKPDLKDEALLKLFEASNVANISAQAIHPTLANIETAGKLSSGTEIRNAFLMYLVIVAPAYRDLLNKVVELVKKENGWPKDVKFAIRDAELTTLADNPSGVRPAETQVGK